MTVNHEVDQPATANDLESYISAVGERLGELAAKVQEPGRPRLLLETADEIEQRARELRRIARDLTVAEGSVPAALTRPEPSAGDVLDWAHSVADFQRDRMRSEEDAGKRGGDGWLIAAAKKATIDDLIDWIRDRQGVTA